MRPEVVYLSQAGELPVAPGRGAHAPVAVIADLPEEHIERVALPRVRGADLARLVARRLAQQFADTPYRLALALRSGPGEATHALIGIPADKLDALLAPTVQSCRGVVGVWTVSLLVAWWLRLARLRPPHLLAVVVTPAGVRHVFLSNGIPVLSRLVPHNLAGHDEEGLRDELKRTVQYLYNARLIERGTALAAWSLGAAVSAASALEELRWQTPPAVKDLPDIGARGLAALVELLQRRAPRSQLAPASVRLHWHARRLRLALTAAAAIVSAALLLPASTAFLQTALDRAAAAALRAELDAIETQEAQATAAAAAAGGVTPQYAAAVLRIHRREIEAAPRPQTALFALAPAFDAAHEFELHELVWRAAQRDRTGAPQPADGDAEAGCAAPNDGEAAVVSLAGRVGERVALRSAERARERFERALAQPVVARLQMERAPVAAAGPIDSAAGAREFAYCVWLRGE